MGKPIPNEVGQAIHVLLHKASPSEKIPAMIGFGSRALMLHGHRGEDDVQHLTMLLLQCQVGKDEPCQVGKDESDVSWTG